MITLRIFCLLLLFSLLNSNLFSQKWGEVSKDALKMTSIPDDPEADAVILFDKGTMDITTTFKLVFGEHSQIKILTERGKKYADVRIFYLEGDNVNKIDAVTWLPNGKKVKLDQNTIYEKTGDLWNEKVFAFPAVEVGAVLEYRYERRSESLHFLNPWDFQAEEFTKLSSLEIFLPDGFNYNTFFANYPGITEPKTAPVFRMESNNKKVYSFFWKLEDVPGIKSEPYMTNTDDYLARVYFQLVSFNDGNHDYKFIATWNDLAKTVREYYKEFLNLDSGLKELANQKLSGITNRNERIKVLYEFVRDQIETADFRGLMNSNLRKPDRIIKMKSGSAVEKNLLLINLLNQAGIDARPLLISTRNNGKFQPSWAQLQQFNHLLVAIASTTKLMLLDPGDRFSPLGMLPPNDLNGQGLLVEKDKGEIVKIPAATCANLVTAQTRANLTEDGDLICRTVLQFEDYEARKVRTKLSLNNKEEFVKTILEDKFESVEFDSFRITGENDLNLPVKFVLNYKLRSYAQATGELFYMNPALMHRLQSNPFKREKRNFPVEYDYLESSREEVEINLPAGLKLTEMPKLTRFTLPFMIFNATCEIAENQIKFVRDFRLRQTLFQNTAYNELRKSYEEIISSDQAQLVLTKQAGNTTQSK